MGKDKTICTLGLLLALLLLLATEQLGPFTLPVTAPAANMTESAPLVALTFDDGPSPDTTVSLLDGLARLRQVQRGLSELLYVL